MIVFWVVLVLFGCMASFLLGNLLSWCRIVEPLQETEALLRKELRTLRGELWANGIEISNLRTWVIMHHQFQAPGFTPRKGRNYSVPHRTHSEFLPFDSIDDLIKGTKP